jgi:hypothetical protein
VVLVPTPHQLHQFCHIHVAADHQPPQYATKLRPGILVFHQLEPGVVEFAEPQAPHSQIIKE